MAGKSAAERGAVGQAFTVALKSLPRAATDGATVALAVRLCEAVDGTGDPRVLVDVSARLLAVLTALGMTPAARAAVTKGRADVDTTGSASPASLLDLRDRSAQRARLRSAPDMDTPAS